MPPAGQVAWWPGDGNPTDIVANNAATPHSGLTFDPGLVGQAFRFDGINAYLSVPHSTDPRSAASAFKITGIHLTSSAVTIEWAGSTNHHYRVNRSLTASRDNYSTVTNGVRGIQPLNNFTDTLATNRTSFYWVETE